MGVFDLSAEEREEIENAPEPQVFESDEEVTLRLVGFREAPETGEKVFTNKSGGLYVHPELEIIGVPDAEQYKTFLHYVPIPKGLTDPKKKLQAERSLQRFCKAFGVEIDPESLDDWIGSEAEAILRVERSDQYGDQNGVKRFVD